MGIVQMGILFIFPRTQHNPRSATAYNPSA